MAKRKPKPADPQPDEPPRTICPECGGSGSRYNGTDQEKCAACGGKGVANPDVYRSVNDPEVRK